MDWFYEKIVALNPKKRNYFAFGINTLDSITLNIKIEIKFVKSSDKDTFLGIKTDK